MKNRNKDLKRTKGISLLEILVVITIFAVLGILVTQSVILTIRGSRKSETLVKVRENLNYAMSIVERQLRNSNSITTCDAGLQRIDYTDQDDEPAYFSCNQIGSENSHIASGSGTLSARLTNPETKITSCSFSCTLGPDSIPTIVNIDFTAEDAGTTGIENSRVTITNQIYLRNY